MLDVLALGSYRGVCRGLHPPSHPASSHPPPGVAPLSPRCTTLLRRVSIPDTRSVTQHQGDDGCCDGLGSISFSRAAEVSVCSGTGLGAAGRIFSSDSIFPMCRYNRVGTKMVFLFLLDICFSSLSLCFPLGLPFGFTAIPFELDELSFSLLRP